MTTARRRAKPGPAAPDESYAFMADPVKRLLYCLACNPILTIRVLGELASEAPAIEAKSPVRSWLIAQRLDARDVLEAIVARGKVTFADLQEALAGT